MTNITQESVCNYEMETADFLARLRSRNGIVKQQILKNITQEFVYNYEMKTAEFLADLRNQKRNRKAT
ncbi:hypothetical protein, partial [Tenacibaculum finnmarkense]|uniref:hypothetical protein n=1 Tax=Tenacibaculum finnmarkense TaxID=2781243 RepID=UPI001EFA2F00